MVVAALVAAAGLFPSRASELTLVRSDDSVIEVRATFDAPRTEPDLNIPGMARRRTISEPELPFRSSLVAIPPRATVRLEIDDPQAMLLDGFFPAPFVAPLATGDSPHVATDPARDRPYAPVEIDFDGFLMDRRVLRLVFHPLTPDESGRGTVYHPRLTARLILDGATRAAVFGPATGSARPTIRDRFEQAVYERTIINEHRIDAAAYRDALAAERPAPNVPRESARSMGGPLPAKISVRGDGLWTVTHADLLAAGIDAGGAANSDISLTVAGLPVRRRVIDGGDGTFDAGDRIEFYGSGIDGQIEYDTNVYRLAFDESPGQPVPTRNAAPSGGTLAVSFDETLRFEDNQVFFTTHADSDGDRIGWERLSGDSGGNASGTYTFELPDLDPAAASIVVRARIYDLGGSHTTALLLNGVDLLDPRSWSSGDVTHDATTSAANLLPGTNTLTVQVSGSPFNQLVVNWIEIEYPRLHRALGDVLAFESNHPAPVAHQVSGFGGSNVVVYDVTDPAAPVRLSGLQISGSPGDFTASFTDTVGGARAFVARAGSVGPAGPLLVDQPSDLGNPVNAADLIVLAYRDFVDEMVPLVNARLAQGWRVQLVDLEDVFDEYAFGRPDPAAIKAFLADAYASWQPPAPAFLLLVGNATLDPLQQLPGSVPPLMPTGRFIAPTLGLAASDNALVTFLGADPLPDMFVGRIPARTEMQAADAVAKIVAYDSVPPGLLNQRVLLVADNDQLSFEFIQEDLDTLYLSNTVIPAERAYLRTLGTAATNQKIRDTINEGAIVTNYFGHGNIHNWAAENIFVDTVDLPLLTNSDRPTFMSTLNCINGFHAGPRTTSLDSFAELALLEPGGGAIGAWSPSALALLSDYVEISEVLFRQLFVDREQRLGVATTTAKIEAWIESGTSAATLDEMHLFGDPTTVLRVDGDLDDLTDFVEDAAGLAARDADSDDDGLRDGDEVTALADTDSDGRIDALDTDSDDDGLFDGVESGIVTPGGDTDPSVFVPDADPASMTNPRDADSDGGGAPDGAEDRNANGAIDAGETDPGNPADDPVCDPGPAMEASGLRLAKNAADVVLSWDDQVPADPCVLYRVYVATDAAASDGAAFAAVVTATLPSWSHRDALAGASTRHYLVTTTSPLAGEGPRGHHGQ